MAMLLNQQTLEKLPVGSIRSSSRIGNVSRLVINPATLHVDAIECQIISMGTQLLVPDDIFEISPRGVVIRDHDHLLDPTDAVRLKKILELRYSLIGKQAYVDKRKVGTVTEIAIDSESMFIMKFYVKPNLLMKLRTSQLLFDRQAVREVTNRRVVFEDSSQAPLTSPQPSPTP